MRHVCKICSPHVAGLTDDAHADSDDVASAERVDNLRVRPMRVGRARAAVERLKLWENGRTLRVRFLDGSAAVQAKVEAIAKEWEAIAHLKLDFVTSGPTQIRVSFAEQGFSWSTVGTDALIVGPDEATMNYGWLEPDTDLREYQRVVRHEFGHALGMIHEHQNPAAHGQIPWDRPKVYAHYAEQGWSTADVDANIFDVYAEDSTNHTAFDAASIMQYAVPDALTVGSFAIGWNTEFSPADVDFMKRQYPNRAAPANELVPDGHVTADLATAGEVDTYPLTIAQAGTYILSTEGTTDTVLALHGPNDPGALLAWDDDGGRGTNARIVRRLLPGSYWLTVRHWSSDGTGSYTVRAKKRH